MSRKVFCVRLKKYLDGLDAPLYPGELGNRIYENVSKEAWSLWLSHQTLLINENHLSLADSKSREYLAKEMEKFFFEAGGDKPAGYIPTNEG